MQDSDVTSGFTVGADIYAAYVLSDTGEGHGNYAATVARFPAAKHLSICTRFNATAQVLDFEEATTGVTADDAQQCVQWVVRMRQQGGLPSVYVQLSLWTWLAGVFDAAGVDQPGWWIAHWTGVAHLEPGSDATQWQGGSLVDLNSVADYWPTVDSGLVPSGGGTPIGGNDLGTIDNTDYNKAVIRQAVLGALKGAGGDEGTPIYGAPNPVNWAQWIGDARGVTADSLAGIAAQNAQILAAVNNGNAAENTALQALANAVHLINTGTPVDEPTLAADLALSLKASLPAAIVAALATALQN